MDANLNKAGKKVTIIIDNLVWTWVCKYLSQFNKTPALSTQTRIVVVHPDKNENTPVDTERFSIAEIKRDPNIMLKISGSQETAFNASYIKLITKRF
jgi:hypothetical protein